MEKYKLLFKCFFRKKKLVKYCLRMFSILIITFMLLLGFKEKLSSKLISLKHQKINNYYILLSLNEERDNVIDEIKNISHIKNAYYLIGITEDSYLYTYID